jgi:hypothetical protein
MSWSLIIKAENPIPLQATIGSKSLKTDQNLFIAANSNNPSETSKIISALNICVAASDKKLGLSWQTFYTLVEVWEWEGSVSNHVLDAGQETCSGTWSV